MFKPKLDIRTNRIFNKYISQRIKHAHEKDKKYENYNIKNQQNIDNTREIIIDIFGKDVSTIILPYVFPHCYACNKELVKYKKFHKSCYCLECYYIIKSEY